MEYCVLLIRCEIKYPRIELCLDQDHNYKDFTYKLGLHNLYVDPKFMMSRSGCKCLASDFFDLYLILRFFETRFNFRCYLGCTGLLLGLFQIVILLLQRTYSVVAVFFSLWT